MPGVQIGTRIDNKEKLLFEQTAKSLGMSPSVALKIFIAKFNAEHGFPFEIKQNQRVDAFVNEEEVMDFIDEIGGEMYENK